MYGFLIGVCISLDFYGFPVVFHVLQLCCLDFVGFARNSLDFVWNPFVFVWILRILYVFPLLLYVFL